MGRGFLDFFLKLLFVINVPCLEIYALQSDELNFRISVKMNITRLKNSHFHNQHGVCELSILSLQQNYNCSLSTKYRLFIIIHCTSKHICPLRGQESLVLCFAQEYTTCFEIL